MGARVGCRVRCGAGAYVDGVAVAMVPALVRSLALYLLLLNLQVLKTFEIQSSHASQCSGLMISKVFALQTLRVYDFLWF